MDVAHVQYDSGLDVFGRRARRYHDEAGQRCPVGEAGRTADYDRTLVTGGCVRWANGRFILTLTAFFIDRKFPNGIIVEVFRGQLIDLSADLVPLHDYSAAIFASAGLRARLNGRSPRMVARFMMRRWGR